MSDNAKIKLITFSNQMWDEMKEHIEEMRLFLSQNVRTDNTIALLYNALKLVVSELVINEDMASKYPVQAYFAKDFADKTIESLDKPTPDMDNPEANDKRIEEIRKIIWGHIQSYGEKMSILLRDLTRTGADDTHVVTGTEMILLKECLTVVFVECILRKREIMLLKKQYS